MLLKVLVLCYKCTRSVEKYRLPNTLRGIGVEVAPYEEQDAQKIHHLLGFTVFGARDDYWWDVVAQVWLGENDIHAYLRH